MEGEARKRRRKISEETRRKLSLANRKLSEQSRANILYGIRHNRYTPEYAKKLSDTKLGEINPQAILTADDVREIRRLYRPYKCSQYKLAEMYGVGRSTIQDIIERKTWAHI